MGGALARPQDHWPALFTDPFWGNHPYFLPCAVAACLLFLALFMMVFFLEEVGSTYLSHRTCYSRSADIINKASTKVDISHGRRFEW
jgi:hypothetical protein